MVSLKKESVIMEITPVHLMSEEEADEKFQLSRAKSVSGRADGKSVTPDSTAECFAEVSDKTHTKKRKHNTGNNAKAHIVSFFSKVAQNVRDTDYEVLAIPCMIILCILTCVAVIVMLVNIFEPVRPVADNLEISTYETSGIYKFTISDELKHTFLMLSFLNHPRNYKLSERVACYYPIFCHIYPRFAEKSTIFFNRAFPYSIVQPL